MSVITTTQELARVLSGRTAGEDPRTDLERRGYKLSPALARRVATLRPSKPIDAPRRERWAAAAREAGPVHYLEGLPPRGTPRERAAGDWDIVAAVGFDAVDAALAGLHATRVVPRDIDLGLVLSSSELTDLIAEVLQDVFEGVPDGINSIVLRLDPAPTARPIVGTDGAELTLPFTLDLGRTSVFAGRTTLTSIVGTLQLGVSLDAEVSFVGTEGRLTIALGLPYPPSTEQALAITIAADSPVQPRSGSRLDSLVTVLGLIVTRRLGPSLPSWVIAPLIHLPLGTNTNLLVRQVGVRAVDTGGGGAIVVGVRAGGLLPEPGDLDNLTNPFAERGGNLFLRVHEELVRNVLRAAHRSGYLDELAREVDESARIEDVDASFTRDEIRFHVRGRLVDGCGLWKDLPFEVVHAVKFALEGDRIVLTRQNNVHVGTLDAVLCFLTSVLEGAIVGAVAGLASGLLVGMLGGIILGIVAGLAESLATRPVGRLAAQAIWDFIHGEDSGGPDTTMIDLDRPVPGTELLPQIEGLDVEVDDVSLQTWNRITLVPDTINTYAYVALAERGLFLPRSVARPIPGVRIECMDQDVPAPPGDDARPPLDEPEQVVVSNRKRLVTVSTIYRPPTQDQRLASATTDMAGIARFVLRPSQLRTTAGRVERTRMTEYLDQPQRETDYHTTTTVLVERAPDVYFRGRLVDGRSLDSRTLAPGLLLNLSQRRIGTPDSPLTFAIPERVLVLDPR
jgi:hypothetical protein